MMPIQEFSELTFSSQYVSMIVSAVLKKVILYVNLTKANHESIILYYPLLHLSSRRDFGF